jgi:hypothetical protein
MISETPGVAVGALAASRNEQLQRIRDAGLIQQSRVFLLSLEPMARGLEEQVH